MIRSRDWGYAIYAQGFSVAAAARGECSSILLVPRHRAWEEDGYAPVGCVSSSDDWKHRRRAIRFRASGAGSNCGTGRHRQTALVQGRHTYPHAELRRRLHPRRSGAVVSRAWIRLPSADRSQLRHVCGRPQCLARRRRTIPRDQRRRALRSVRRQAAACQRP
jgi:hypothetical protein